MKRLIGGVVVVGLVSVGWAGEVVLDVDAGGLKGSATLVNQLLPNGSKYVRLGMLLEDATGKSVSVLQESTYDKTGRPVRLLQRTNLKGGSALQSVVVTFDDTGANFKVDQGGKTVNDTIKYPAGKSVLATPEFWFIRDMVNPGGVKSYWRFDMAKQDWAEIKCEYHGKRDLKWGGKTVNAHLVTMGDGRAYLDDAGDPYVVETGNGKMVRRAK